MVEILFGILLGGLVQDGDEPLGITFLVKLRKDRIEAKMNLLVLQVQVDQGIDQVVHRRL